ncbi:ABC transporter permease [Aeromicrobium terrae]|uniref:Molybdenum transport system permease n=1 Tax=Aeromicrobium terrae TaxID=2498846 RepID=A0A5C8NIA6_9ACTN|nr:ABC transporter permease [Aeromicrobium terrae]TXL61499.1 molybdate ABC transporter permease subunit [Aeromicrobium terrae]
MRRSAPPPAVVVAAGLATLLLVVPLVALFVRAPWSTLGDLLTSDSLLTALRLSLVTASIATVVCVLVGVPLAWVLARVDFRGRSLVRSLVTVPLVLPPVVAGVALLTAFGRNGFVGEPLRDAFGVTIPFSTTAVVLAQVFVAMPFLVISVEGSFRTADPTLDEEAAMAGASRWQTFLRVNVPLAMPGILAGAVLAWARAIGEFGATITFAGNSEGVTRTMPLEIYTALQTDPEPAIALSIVLLVLSVAVLAALRERWLSNPWE